MWTRDDGGLVAEAPTGETIAAASRTPGGRRPAGDFEDFEDFEDFDEIAVERTLAGERVELDAADRVEVARRVLAAGRPKTHVAEVLHISGCSTAKLITQLQEQRAVNAR